MCVSIDVQIFLFMAFFAVHLTPSQLKSLWQPPEICARVAHKSIHCCRRPPLPELIDDDNNNNNNVDDDDNCDDGNKLENVANLRIVVHCDFRRR